MGVIENAKEIGELIKKYNDQDLYEFGKTINCNICKNRST
jgi:hypothetical protein